MTITSAIITLNEERNIERCIRSVQSFSDEIIVLDSLSTDRTKEICESFGVRFVERTWEGYSASKNYLNSLAKSEYIFSIDADEAASDELHLDQIHTFLLTDRNPLQLHLPPTDRKPIHFLDVRFYLGHLYTMGRL